MLLVALCATVLSAAAAQTQPCAAGDLAALRGFSCKPFNGTHPVVSGADNLTAYDVSGNSFEGPSTLPPCAPRLPWCASCSLSGSPGSQRLLRAAT